MDEGVRRVRALITRKSIVLLAAFFLYFTDYAAGQTRPRHVHVFVALADNEHQGIVPVASRFGEQRRSGPQSLLGRCI